MKKNIFVFLPALLLLAGVAYVVYARSNQKVSTTSPRLTTSPTAQNSMDNNTPSPSTKTYSAAPALSIDKSKKYTAILHTSEGDMTMELFANQTPITVNNFVFLAGEKFYDNTIFHRVMEGFMIQGGDPTGTGRGGPGYQFDDEAFDEKYTRGTVAMANAGPNTNGSQFFIMHKDYALPPDYIIFGRVTQGLDVLDRIATAPVTSSPTGEDSKPVTPAKITSIEISQN
jgi:cyclophilin family peptidyl-prolyl cis-trans isomerase